MTAVDELLATGPVDPIKNGRYHLPGTDGKRRYYTRATTIAKVLDDHFLITQADRRKVATGIARTPSLAAAVLADHDDKRRLDTLCETAIANAGGVESRDLGSALHRLIERVDLGQLTHDGEWAEHISAYQGALKAHRLIIRPEWCETVLVNETYGVAGRVDRLLEDPEGRLVVADLKTGGFRSWLSWAIQFAVYATATHYWVEASDQLVPIAPGMIRQDHTLAIHLPAAEIPPRCQIIPISVPVGMDGLLMALEVRRMRALDREPHVTAVTYHPPTVLDQMERMVVETFNPEAQRAALTERIATLKELNVDAARVLLRRWPDGVPLLKRSDQHTPQQLTAISKVLDRIEADHGVAF